MTVENDIVLIYMEDTPVSFARVEDIQADSKKDWYHIKLLMLQVPLQVVTWILKDDYINGEEFYMGGKKMKLERVESPEEAPMPVQAPFEGGAGEEDAEEEERPAPQEGEDAEIISFDRLRQMKSEDDPER